MALTDLMEVNFDLDCGHQVKNFIKHSYYRQLDNISLVFNIYRVMPKEIANFSDISSVEADWP